MVASITLLNRIHTKDGLMGPDSIINGICGPCGYPRSTPKATQTRGSNTNGSMDLRQLTGPPYYPRYGSFNYVP